MDLQHIFNAKVTENGDLSFKKVQDNELLNILFLTEYYQKHLDEVPVLEPSDRNRLFAMMIRDPRLGLGRRDLGRKLMGDTQCSIEQIVKAGRVDDLFFTTPRVLDYIQSYKEALDWCYEQIKQGNELVKKWMPRYSSKNLLLARQIAKYWGMNKQQYGHFIKCNTTENKMSDHRWDDLAFEHIPSLAMIKYAAAFARKSETKERYAKYLEDVKAGKKDLKISTTSVYDIYRNRSKIDADLFFNKLEKISGSWIPIVDSSGSMMDSNDSYGKAVSLGHYLAKCSTCYPNQVISFSSEPQLITLGTPLSNRRRNYYTPVMCNTLTQYGKEIDSMYTGDCSNTDFGRVMELLSHLDTNLPEYLIVLSDMEFDCGSSMSKDATMQLFKSKGYPTRIIWWNLNSRNITCPEMDNDGNIFISGYNPLMLKFLKAGFNAEEFLNNLIEEYKKAIEA
jgi:hypothetical protein